MNTHQSSDPLPIAREAAKLMMAGHGVREYNAAVIVSAIEQATAALRAENEKLRADCVEARDFAAETAARFQYQDDKITGLSDNLFDAEAELTALRRDKERLIAAAVQAKEALEEADGALHAIAKIHPALVENVYAETTVDEALTALSAALDQKEGQP